MQRPAKLGHMTESHQIFDRVTTLEANVDALHDSVRGLATTVGETNAAVAEIKSLVSGVGKTDGKTIITLGATVIGAMVMVGSIFLGPIQRDVQYLERKIAQDSAAIENTNSHHVELVKRDAEIEGDMKLVDWRLKALEEKPK